MVTVGVGGWGSRRSRRVSSGVQQLLRPHAVLEARDYAAACVQFRSILAHAGLLARDCVPRFHPALSDAAGGNIQSEQFHSGSDAARSRASMVGTYGRLGHLSRSMAFGRI